MLDKYLVFSYRIVDNNTLEIATPEIGYLIGKKGWKIKLLSKWIGMKIKVVPCKWVMLRSSGYWVDEDGNEYEDYAGFSSYLLKYIFNHYGEKEAGYTPLWALKPKK